MQAKTYVVLIPVLLAVSLSACETLQTVLNVERPSASLKGLNFEDVSIDSATLVFDVEVENPYPVALPLTKMNYGLSTGGNSFLSGSAEIAGAVPAKSSKILSLPAKINYIDMLKALKGVRPGTQIPYKASMELSVGSGTVEITSTKGRRT